MHQLTDQHRQARVYLFLRVLSVAVSTAILIPMLSVVLCCLVCACLQGVFAPNERLLHAVQLFEGQVKGPGEQSHASTEGASTASVLWGCAPEPAAN